jgi:hypothetical protein
MSNSKGSKPIKILILSYDFFPEKKPNTYRWFNIAKKWQEDKDVVIHVISGGKNQFIDFEEIDGLKIYRTSEFFIGNLKYKFRENVQVSLNDGSPSHRNVFKKLIRLIYDLTWTKLYWPDHSFLWIFSALPLAKKIVVEEKIDKIITVSWTFSAHVIGLYLKNKFKSIFWLADSVDPFCFDNSINNSFLYNRLNFLIERKVIESANVVSVITPKIRDKYISIFPKFENKFVVNRNIYISPSREITKKSTNVSKSFNFVFLGTLSEEVRSPKNLLILFNLLKEKFLEFDFSLNIYGDISKSLIRFNEYPHLLNSSIFLNGFIDQDEIIQVIYNADILINVGNHNKYQEPSKLIEYIYSGKKILNICSVDDDASVELLNNYPLSLSIFPYELLDNNTLQKVFEFIMSDKYINRVQVDNILNEFTLESVSYKYYNLLTSNSSI